MLSKSFALPFYCAALFSMPCVVRAATLSKTDIQFMKMAAKANMTEAHLGQMAEKQATDQGVKDFGKKLSADHTTSYEQLTVLANKTGEPIPKAIEHDQTIDRLATLKGKSFDRAFIQDEVQSHKAAVAAFKNEAEHGEDADVKAWANSMVPILEGHLQTVENLAKMEKPRK